MSEISLGIKNGVDVVQDVTKVSHRGEEIAQFLKEKLASANLPEFLGKDLNVLNIVSLDKEVGYEFVLPKMHKDFFVLRGDTFHYRHDDVIEILNETIAMFHLKDEIQYDRIMGIFVYNIWEK